MEDRNTSYKKYISFLHAYETIRFYNYSYLENWHWVQVEVDCHIPHSKYEVKPH